MNSCESKESIGCEYRVSIKNNIRTYGMYAKYIVRNLHKCEVVWALGDVCTHSIGKKRGAYVCVRVCELLYGKSDKD